jgi:two-component system response regulator DesR
MTAMTAITVSREFAPLPDETTDSCCPQRILIVDELELMQAGLRSVLTSAPWVQACMVAGSAEVALQTARRHQPQVVLVSTSLGGRTGPELCRTLREHLPHIKVVLISGEGQVSGALAASLGAVAALSKNMSRGALLIAMKRVADGGRVFPKASGSTDVKLSRRELDVLQHLASGLSNPETALTLNLSRHTVKQHTSAVYRKLGVRNRAEAASRAQALGLIAWGTRTASERARAS